MKSVKNEIDQIRRDARDRVGPQIKWGEFGYIHGSGLRDVIYLQFGRTVKREIVRVLDPLGEDVKHYKAEIVELGDSEFL